MSLKKPQGLTLYLQSRRHSPVGITSCVDHVSDRCNLGFTVLCELTRHFHPVLSPSCEAEDSGSGERFQVGLDCGFPCPQLAFSSSAPRARRVCVTFGTSCSMTKPKNVSFARAVPVYSKCRVYDYVKNGHLFFFVRRAAGSDVRCRLFSLV